jgi:glycosyltransferase involved in cell wall biosynthesis
MPDDIPPNVQISGSLAGDALADFVQGSRLVVNPSTCYETFGMSVAEAMLRARPVVVPNHGVFPELIQDGASGVLHSPADANSLARAIRRVWDDPAFAAALGRAARERAVKEYSPEAYYARFMTACDAALASRVPGAIPDSTLPPAWRDG